MHKIDGAGNDSGRFVHENYETGRPPTEVTADWLNSVQEELIAILLAAGIVPDKANNAQVVAAIEFLIKKYAPEPDLSGFALKTDFSNSKNWNGYQKLPSGLILQWGTFTAQGAASITATPFNIAFPNRCCAAFADGAASMTNDLEICSVANIKNTEITIFVSRNPSLGGAWGGLTGSSPDLRWFAIGY